MNQPPIIKVESSRDVENELERYTFPAAKPSLLPRSVLILQSRFGFEPARMPRAEDASIRGRIKNNLRVGLNWSEWFGLIIRAEHARSNEVVREIADYFDGVKDDADLAEYFYEPKPPDQIAPPSVRAGGD
jgi:hypothetical protein